MVEVVRDVEPEAIVMKSAKVAETNCSRFHIPLYFYD